MTSDQVFRKIKKRAKKEGISEPKVISKKGNRWFLIDKMEGSVAISPLILNLLKRRTDAEV